MNHMELLQQIKLEIKSLESKNTPALRTVAKKYFEIVSRESKDEIFDLCTLLLETRQWSLQIIAYDWAFRLRKFYTVDTYTLFEKWVLSYIKDWYDCDDFCCHAFGYLIYRYPELAPRVLEWTKSDNFAVRRAAAVVFIYSVRKGEMIDPLPWIISETLMHDEHYLVLKGYGWLLKEMTKHFKDETIQFLQRYEEVMPRLSFRYAIEKLTLEDKISNFKSIQKG